MNKDRKDVGKTAKHAAASAAIATSSMPPARVGKKVVKKIVNFK
jgi:hypothetical protein